MDEGARADFAAWEGGGEGVEWTSIAPDERIARLALDSDRRYDHFTVGRAAFFCGPLSRPSFFWTHVHLLYVDESGNHADPADHFVVGGLAVHEGAVVPLQRAVEAAIERRLDPHLRTLEIHAQHMRAGKGAWRGIPKEVRAALLSDIVRAVIALRRRRPHDVALFAAVHAPGAVADVDTLERTFEEQLLRFTQMLYRFNPGAREPRGLVIADRARYETELQPLARRWRESGTRFTRLTRLVEVPLFVDSHLARLVQVADIVAHVVYRRYRDGQDPLFDALLPAFDAQDGVLHGLVHLTPGARACACPPCASRARRARGR